MTDDIHSSSITASTTENEKDFDEAFFVVLFAVVVLMLSWSDSLHHSSRDDDGCCDFRKTVVVVVSSFKSLTPIVPHRPLLSKVPLSLRKERSLWMTISTSTTITVNATANDNSGDEVHSNGYNFRNKNFIPPEELEKILDNVDIVALIESYGILEFKRTTSNGGSTGFYEKATCLCPFHDDRNPSLKIDGERGIYKCFSCGSGGNALKFVREYSERYYNHHDDEDDGDTKNRASPNPLTFLEAVRVLEDFAMMPAANGVQRRRHRQRLEKTWISIQKNNQTSLIGSSSRERILLANFHAAAYFEECLFGLPSAGIARTHLRSRGIHPSTVKSFAIGFAPESYFFTEGQRQQQSLPWGEGSVVHRLRDKGFTPQEILDAGLAILTKKGKQRQEQERFAEDNHGEKKSNNEKDDNNNNNNSNINTRDFSNLMDRFRGRLIVPIFDATGTQVLGFGGRILQTSGKISSDYKVAKYLNSPESLVFRKKELLFGRHMVKFVAKRKTIGKDSLDGAKTVKATTRRSLIVVEGYMDAIAMWQAGIEETVASMGTALSQEQLLAAASIARDIGGRVVLCLDNDVAGIAAITRLCTGSVPILLSVIKQSKVEIFVAKIPESVKDPAEFLEEHRDVDNVDEKFRDEVIQNSQEWRVWYMFHLIAAHDPSASAGEDGSFSQIFDNVASFLSLIESVEERTKKAEVIASKLADLVDAGNVNTDDNDNSRLEVSRTTYIELASNLIEKAASIAHSKSTSFQRSFQVTRSSAKKEPFVPRSFEISQDMTSAEEGNTFDTKKSIEAVELESVDDSFIWTQEENKSPKKRQRARLKRRHIINPPRRHMTKHIAGFKSNTFDDEWLGVTKDKYTNQRNPLRYELNVAQATGQTKKYIGPELSIRFNKNEYHGTWTTSAATAAGYTHQSIPNKKMDFLGKGTSSLIQTNEEDTSMFVEDLLFSILVRFSEARKSLHESIRISEASGSGSKIICSSLEKSWLFKCLVEEMDEIPQDIVGLKDLEKIRSYLKKRPDAFPGAFGSIFEHESHSSLNEIDDQVTSFVVDLSTEQLKSTLVDDETIIVVDDSVDSSEERDLSIEPSTISLDISAVKSLPTVIPTIPEIDEEWSDFPEIDDLGGEYFENKNILDGDVMTTEIPTVDDSNDTFLDPKKIGGTASIIDTNKTDFLEAVFVAAEIPFPHKEEDKILLVEEGSLDRFFVEGAGNCEIFTKHYSDADSISNGSNEDKANWAIQDLYTILELTSVLKRVEAGRSFMVEHQESWFNKTVFIQDDNTTSTATEKDLAEYCSPQATGGGLLKDLQRIFNLKEKNKKATERIFSLMHADFLDKSAGIRGYSWLKNVLRLNELKMVEWNDIIESKEDFRNSDEVLDDLEDTVFSDWNELSDPGEMWEFDKNVNHNHRSHFADLVIDREDSESPNEFIERYEDEWEGLFDDDDDVDNHERSESLGEIFEQCEDSSNSVTEEDVIN